MAYGARALGSRSCRSRRSVGCDTKPHESLLNSQGECSLVFCHQCPTEACDQRNPVVREPSGPCRLTRKGGELTVR